jgi:type VI secretion system secreted protein VgrG
MLVRGFTGWEAISAPFQLDLELVSENDAVDLRGLLAANVTLRIALSDDSTRWWNGRISKIVQAARDPVFTSYRVEVVPWFSFLSLRQDCRIFQDKTVQEIVSEVFSNLGFQDFEFRVHGDLPKRDYCVQYRETDFHFVSRLLEEEGIFYFFEHESGRHTMVMGNTPEAHVPCPGDGTARCLQSSGGTPEDDVVTDWNRNEEFLTSSLTLTDYNFQTPATSLLTSRDGNSPFEMYDYPGLYQQKQPGETLARIRLEEISTPGSVIQGESTCRTFASGYRFQLQDHYRQDWNSDYVLIDVHHAATQGSDYHAGSIEASGDESSYSNHFQCIPRAVPFRPMRKTARPIMTGCQTAVVVGPSGEEIYTDEFGRIKVQFHWDREGQKNEKSSCWIRVAQPLAGTGWGAVAIPRIGQEVVVEFLEGNPDRPLVTGCVYNAQMTPPYPLPANKDLIGIKSNSTKGGGGYNEIVIQDVKGSELIRIHGQNDMNTTILHDQKEMVKNNKNVHVSKELRIQVDQKVSHTINGDLAEQFTQNHAEVVTHERYLKANRIIFEADQEICIKVGSNHVHISSAGVYVEGTMVDINCGHPPQNTALSGLTSTKPDDPA